MPCVSCAAGIKADSSWASSHGHSFPQGSVPEPAHLLCGLGELLLPLIMGRQRISELLELVGGRNTDMKPSAVLAHPEDGANGLFICSGFRACQCWQCPAEQQDPGCSTALWPFPISSLHHSALLGAIHLEAGQSFPFLILP